jgi:hypothetical protein
MEAQYPSRARAFSRAKEELTQKAGIGSGFKHFALGTALFRQFGLFPVR